MLLELSLGGSLDEVVNTRIISYKIACVALDNSDCGGHKQRLGF